MSIVDLKKGISSLSSKKQVDLAYWIIFNLDASANNEDVVESSWRQEVRDRVAAIKSGKVHMIPAKEMWKDIFDNYVKTS